MTRATDSLEYRCASSRGFRVPSIEGICSSATCIENSPAVTPPTTQRILLVEDDTAIRELTGDVLSESGYEITAVGDAEAAVTALCSAGSFDLLISDIRLPGMNGCELARHAMGRDPALRVLLMTGYAGQFAGDPEILPRHIPLLRKPFTLRELLKSVHSTI